MEIKTRKGLPFYIDDEDYEKVDAFIWRVDHGYVRNSKAGYLHRFLLGSPKSRIDHIDGNPLNNKKENLRICTQQQNTMNKRKTKKGTSKFKGVSWLKRDKKWYACINKNYKTYNIGYFDDEMEAAKAYDKKAVEMFGEFARTNYV